MVRSTFGSKVCWLLISLLFSAAVTAADWPQWRGPERNGMSPEKGLLSQWPEGGPALKWRSAGFGNGYSSLSVAGERLYTMGDTEGAQHVIAARRADGQILWKTKVGPVWKDRYGGSRGTPTVDGNRVYAIGTEGDLVCLDAQSGAVIWRKSLTGDFGGKMSAGQRVHWKYSESPLIDGDRVIVTPGANDAALVALNKATGAEIWRTAIPNLGEKGADGAGYSSVVISNGGGVRQYVQMLGRGVVGIEAGTGRFLWGYNRVANDVANIATPIIDGDHVFVTTGYGTGSALLKLSGSGNGVAVEEVYFLEGSKLQNHHGGVILLDGYLYTGTGHNKGLPICVRMRDGEAAWGPERNEGGGSAAVSYADGHLYMRYQNGLMVQAAASAEGYRETGSFLIPDVEKESWAHPVVSGGRLWLREQDNLLVYDIKAAGD